MKKTCKILLALLVVMTLMVGMFAVTASAVKTTVPTTLYLSPNTNWKTDNPRYAVYTWDGGDKWFDMTDSNGDGVYEVTIPAGIENIIFCRMSPSATANNWTNKWNQTADLKYDGTNNHYTVKEGTWDKGGGSWSLLEVGSCIHTPKDAGTVITAATCTVDGKISHTCSKCGVSYTATLLADGHKYTNGKCSVCNTIATYTIAGTGAFLGTEWDTTNVANDMTRSDDGTYTKVYTNVAAGTYKFKCAQDHAWNVAYPDQDKEYTVATAGSTVTITLKGTTVSVVVEAPKGDENCEHSWTPANCTTPKTCSKCKLTEGSALGHTLGTDGNCTACDYAPLYIVAGDVMKDASENYVEGTNFFGGSIWIETDENNKLTYNSSTGLFEKTYSGVKKGEYHFKVVLNKSWTTSYGNDGTADNCYIKVESDNSTVTITFDPKTDKPASKVAAPHTHTEEAIPAVEATCTTAGSTAGVKCSTCDEILTAPTEVAAKGHSYESSVQAPTCTETGLTTYTCSACKDSYTEEIPVLGHTYDETQWGYKGADGHAHICSSCGAKQELLAHTPNADAATEETAKYCTACEYVIEPAVGHVCDLSVLKYDAEGHWYKCTGCEATSEKVAHEGGKATCTEQAKCSVCEQYYGEALGHTWVDANCTTPKTCSVCSATEGEALGHTWVDANCTTPKTCSVCSATEGDALGHKFVDGECSCGEKDPNYVAPVEPQPDNQEPDVELNFFEKIWKAITDFFAQILGWFKNLVPATEE